MNVSGVHHPIDRPRGPMATIKRGVKRIAKRTLTSRLVSSAWAPLVRDQVTFIMLHRFAEPEYGAFGHDLEHFRRVLARLRRDGYAILSAEEAVRRLIEREAFPRRSVAFTMDDGYRGAFDGCADVCLEYDCPLTIFVTTGFIDGTCWFWWDQIEYVCLTSGREEIAMQWNGSAVRLRLGSRRATIISLLEVCEWCKTLPDEEKWRFIRALAELTHVEIPTRPPAQYAPLSWDELRSLEARGFSMGPHTVTHPILPRTTDRQAAWEISESWARVRQELRRPLSIFAYPNGAYGERELSLLEQLGLDAAVTTRGAYASSSPALSRYEIPRFGYPEEPEPLLLITSGFKRLELSLRR